MTNPMCLWCLYTFQMFGILQTEGIFIDSDQLEQPIIILKVAFEACNFSNSEWTCLFFSCSFLVSLEVFFLVFFCCY